MPSKLLNQFLQSLNRFNNISSSKKSNSQKEIKPSNKKIYYKFICKCNTNEEFTSFTSFLEHTKTSHNIQDLNPEKIYEIIKKYNNNKWEIKFYWGLKCKCGNKFTSSLCNADITIKNNKIVVLKLYNLQCKICEQTAQFRKIRTLNKFLANKVLQILIYKHYSNEFNKYNKKKEYKEELEGHLPKLCQKCKESPSGHCWED